LRTEFYRQILPTIGGSTMLPVARALLVSVPLFVACVDTPSESTAISARVIGNRLVADTLVSHKAAATKVAAQKLAACQVTPTTFNVNSTSATELLSTATGREVFSALVACALPETVAIEAMTPIGPFEFLGDVGLAPEWLAQPLYTDSKRWISACLFARVTSADVALPVSLRGPTPALATESDERSAFALQEGGFYGNYFTPKDDPIQWYACRGIDKARGNAGDLANRNCAAPDPANPGLSLCGFIFAGDCAPLGGAHACEQFAQAGTFFQRCHGDPTMNDKFPASSPSFLQVATTYVLP
jgi:hypothetical protein